MDSIAIVLGTRPEIIKMSPIISLCLERKVNFFIIHTNQHYSKYLDRVFFKQLRLPQPDYSLNVGSGTHGEQTGKMLLRIENILLNIPTSFVLVHGDTNTTLAGALSAAKLNIPLGHVESGLRSNDRKMPEEINRIITDHLADLCFVPTINQMKFLQNEGIDSSKIIVTGNTIVDAIYRNLHFIDESILNKLEIEPDNYFLITIHRPENVEDKFRLEQILIAIADVGRSNNINIIAPLHPRTIKLIEQFKISVDPIIKIIEPVGYFQFLALLKHTKLVITDSGGVQEEACILGVPCVTVRENTERPETLDVGANILGGFVKANIINAINIMKQKKGVKWKNPFGKGKSASMIIDLTLKYLKNHKSE